MFSFQKLISRIRSKINSSRFEELSFALENVLSAEDYQTFIEEAPLWAPEIFWKEASTFVNQHVPKNPEDASAVYAYATLCHVSVPEMRKRMLSQNA